RAFLDKQRKVLIFDEPTAHLDIETELELKERMLPLMKDRLVIFATHRLHWMKDMDKIVVLKDGKIAEEGQYDELLAHQAYFYELLNRAKG
ncbi:thiol reductant ABC exporter subunit CydD, partial [Bacillus velezensis]|nr:thiol reductant ABC exporter subunit CydD [Bacillus velezensis]